MLHWASTSTLDNITVGSISELSVSATQTLSVSDIRYTQVGGSLPGGLEVKHDGTITGQVSYTSTGTYTVSIRAYDIVNAEELIGNFSVAVTKPDNKKYTSVYFKPHMTLPKRKSFREFINNEQIFSPSLIYRYHDVNFGVQRQLKMVLDFGVEQLNLEEYLYPLYENFYKKRLRLGSIKSAVAKDSAGNSVYDVVYVDVVDELVNNNNISADSTVHFEWNDELYYPGSVDNMRKQFQSITLRDWTSVGLREDLQPRYMLTQQASDYRTTTYIRAVPLCYTLPGKSNIIINRIKNSGFKFNTIDFEIDRVFIQKSLDSDADKYLLFKRNTQGSLLRTDELILGPEGWLSLDDEDDNTLERE